MNRACVEIEGVKTRLIAAALLATATAMGQSTPSSEARIQALEAKVKSLEEQISNVYNLYFELDERRHNTVDFDPATPNEFQRLDTDTGVLFARLGAVEPYLDGYKVNLFIGNPSTAGIATYKLSVKWASRRKPHDDFAKWLTGQKKKVFDETEELRPGKWTAVAFVLPETTAPDFGYLQVQIDPGAVRMGER